MATARPSEHTRLLRTPLSIGELAERSGVSVSALRFYEQRGLIHSTRSAGNQRRYARDTLRRVAFIRAAQEVGIALEQIRVALDALPDRRSPSRSDWKRLSQVWRAELDHKIAQLCLLRDRLDGCIGCGCLSLTACRLYNREDQLSRRGAGPQRLVG